MTAPQQDEELDTDADERTAREVVRWVVIVGIAIGVCAICLVAWEAWVANQEVVRQDRPAPAAEDPTGVPAPRNTRRRITPPDPDAPAGTGDTAG